MEDPKTLKEALALVESLKTELAEKQAISDSQNAVIEKLQADAKTAPAEKTLTVKRGDKKFRIVAKGIQVPQPGGSLKTITAAELAKNGDLLDQLIAEGSGVLEPA